MGHATHTREKAREKVSGTRNTREKAREKASSGTRYTNNQPERTTHITNLSAISLSLARFDLDGLSFVF